MANREPTILLIPGALTAPSCYDFIVPLLQKAGYLTVSASLPSNNPDDPTAHTAESDGQTILKKHLLPLLDDGRDVIIFAHSFGATAMTGSDRSLTTTTRTSAGLEGGVTGIIYISGCLTPHGQSQVDYLGGRLPAFCKMDTPSPGLFVFDPIIPFLFNDAEPAVAEELAKGHLPHAIKPLATPIFHPLWTDPELEGRRIYFKTMLDATFPPEAQQTFVDNCGVAWDVLEVDGGHEVFLTKPQIAADAIIKAARKLESQ